MNSLFTALNGGLGSLLLAGALLGGALAACDPKVIGNESAGDAVCQPGETKPAGDGCNTCSCADGEWACTDKACADPVCQDGDMKMHEDGCNTCGCVDGQWACTLIGCDGTGGPPGTTTGEPMPECQDGDKKDAGDGCNTCECYEGQWSCTDAACPDTTGGTGVCGDGQLDAGEQCDDGNLEGGDGCGANCTVEGGGVVAICQEPFPKDPLFVTSAVIEGDALLAGVEASGGCKVHDFGYCWDGAFAESDPVQVWTQISHDAHGDQCEAIVSEMLKFDLTPMKKAWQDGYQQQSGQITIHLEGHKDALIYAF
jgi:cysteine-rich repeat protein